MNKFTGIFLVLISLFALWACDPIENSYKQEGYISRIYTVNKAALRPEFEDTLYRMTNEPWEFGLDTVMRRKITRVGHNYYIFIKVLSR